MAKKKKQTATPVNPAVRQDVTEALRVNYMPYAMSVIVSRAIPEIDGFKPSHRKLLYTMYKMNLLKGSRTKSANIVGQTMKLNPHGDQAIYETLVRMARGNETLLVPFVDSKGNFGKVYSRDMAYAAARYTEAKLEPVCEELFSEIGLNAVDMIDNYDGTMKEPALLPTKFPNILCNPNLGIAVGMASNICSFNLREVCNTVIALMRDPGHNIQDTLPGPDFSTGGTIILNKDDMAEIYKTGRGSIAIRAKWHADGDHIIVTEIPYTTTIEAIIDRIEVLAKEGKIPLVTDVRDESDLKGLKLTIDIKAKSDPAQIMDKLYTMTPLQDNFGCNFNLLINGKPQTLGVGSIIKEWVKWRAATKKRILLCQKKNLEDKLHLLEGLTAILLDIDKAIEIIRHTKKDSDVVKNLMAAYPGKLDAIQAEYVANIKLRNINEDYIAHQVKDLASMKKEITKLEDTAKSPKKIQKLIEKELTEVADTYGQDRKTDFIYADQIKELDEADLVEKFNCWFVLSREGYLKTLRKKPASDLKWKDGDEARTLCSGTNVDELWFFTNLGKLYKTSAHVFAETGPEEIGDYVASVLEMDTGEEVVGMVQVPGDITEIVFAYEDGHFVRLPMSLYQTKSNRRFIKNAFYIGAPLVDVGMTNDPDHFYVKIWFDKGKQKLQTISSLFLPSAKTKNSRGILVGPAKAKVKKVQFFCKT